MIGGFLRQVGHDGMIVAATTGEGLARDEAATGRLVQIAAAAIGPALTLYLGMSGSHTRKPADALQSTTSGSGRTTAALGEPATTSMSIASGIAWPMT